MMSLGGYYPHTVTVLWNELFAQGNLTPISIDTLVMERWNLYARLFVGRMYLTQWAELAYRLPTSPNPST